jgi:hypothetical protein
LTKNQPPIKTKPGRLLQKPQKSSDFFGFVILAFRSIRAFLISRGNLRKMLLHFD